MIITYPRPKKEQAYVSFHYIPTPNQEFYACIECKTPPFFVRKQKCFFILHAKSPKFSS